MKAETFDPIRMIAAAAACEVDGPARTRAAGILVQELEGLKVSNSAGKSLIDVRGDDKFRGKWISIPGHESVHLEIMQKGEIVLESKGKATRTVELEFDPLTGTLVGTSRDDSVVPTPGRQFPVRTALSVLVETIIEMGQHRTQSPA